MSGPRYLCGRRPSARVQQRYRVQRHAGSSVKGLRCGGDHSPQRSAPRRVGTEKGPGLLIRRAWREEELRERAQDDSAFEGKIPVLQIFEIARDAVLDVGAVARFAAET